MKISRLEIRNCLGIQELEIPAGKVNLITGGNERGKTSILEVIEKGLRNTDRRTRFIRDGEDKAELYIETDSGLKIDRTVKSTGSDTIKVTMGNNPIKKPETLLKTLSGEFSFNPVDFMAKKDKEQTEILLSLIPMRITEAQLMDWFGEIPIVDLNQHAINVLQYLAEKWYYDKRTLANGQVKECVNQIESIRAQLPDNYDGETWRNINLGEMYSKLDDARQSNSTRENKLLIIQNADANETTIMERYQLKLNEIEKYAAMKREEAKAATERDKVILQNEITAKEEMIKRLQQEIEVTKEKISGLDNVLSERFAKIVDLAEIETNNLINGREVAITTHRASVAAANRFIEDNPVVDTDVLAEECKTTERMKGFISMFDSLKFMEQELINRTALAGQLDGFVDLARKKPAELLKSIVMPIAGLGINDAMQLTIDGLPVRNLSTGRQIKLSLDIARALTGDLKLICIDRFESLDEDQRALWINEMMQDDYQYFITQVTNGDMKVEKRDIA